MTSTTDASVMLLRLFNKQGAVVKGWGEAPWTRGGAQDSGMLQVQDPVRDEILSQSLRSFKRCANTGMNPRKKSLSQRNLSQSLYHNRYLWS